MSVLKRRPFVLIIRDGWGQNPDPKQNDTNAIYLARKPVDDRLRRDYPHVLIRTSGEAVGLPDGVDDGTYLAELENRLPGILRTEVLPAWEAARA